MKKLLILTIGLITLFAAGCCTTPMEQVYANPPRFAYILTQSNIVLGTYYSEQSARNGSTFLHGPFRITPILINVPGVDDAGYIVTP